MSTRALAEAIAIYRQALALDEQVSGHVAVDTAVHLNNLATALEDQGEPAAETSYRESLPIPLRCQRRAQRRFEPRTPYGPPGVLNTPDTGDRNRR